MGGEGEGGSHTVEGARGGAFVATSRVPGKTGKHVEDRGGAVSGGEEGGGVTLDDKAVPPRPLCVCVRHIPVALLLMVVKTVGTSRVRPVITKGRRIPMYVSYT